MATLIVVDEPERLAAADPVRGSGRGRRLPDRQPLQRPAPAARLQPLRVLRLPGQRLLRVAAGRGARPPAAARRADHAGHQVPGADPPDGGARGADAAGAAGPARGTLRAQRLLRASSRRAASAAWPRRCSTCSRCRCCKASFLEAAKVAPAGPAARSRWATSRRTSASSCAAPSSSTSRGACPSPRLRRSRYELAILANRRISRRRRTHRRSASSRRPPRRTASRSRSSGPTTSGDSPSSTRCSSARRPRSTTTPTASRAAPATEGLVVIDDPDSIVRCANKVYLAELMTRLGIPTPKTVIAHRNNVERVEAELGLPCVLKQPDSSFSQGVLKVADARRPAHGAQAAAGAQRPRRRAGVHADRVRLAGRRARPQAAVRLPLLHGRSHWQIYKQQAGGKMTGGRWETLRVEDAPPGVVDLGAARRQRHRRRLLRRRHQGTRRALRASWRSTTTRASSAASRTRCSATRSTTR